jgi:hypothetical protein
MKECCLEKLNLAKERIQNYMDDSMLEEYVKGLEAAIAEIDELIFKSIANKN